MSTIMNFILEGNLKQTVLYTYSTIMNFILEGKLCFTETKRLCRITLIILWSCTLWQFSLGFQIKWIFMESSQIKMQNQISSAKQTYFCLWDILWWILSRYLVTKAGNETEISDRGTARVGPGGSPASLSLSALVSLVCRAISGPALQSIH